ncbi:MAG: alpha-ketoglutarate-dependent dioxygenase AlkB, partial [Steroidobacteraceae bacterium]
QHAMDHAPGIQMPGADLRYFPQFLLQPIADRYFKRLLEELDWRQERVFVWGKWHQQPRLTAWHGDPGSTYSYSGHALTPSPWTPALDELRSHVEQAGGGRYNSVLLNQYRDHNDRMGWHSDNEPELGEAPTIASLSLGATRVLLFRHRSDKSLGVRRIELPHGSLLLMSGDTQKNWLHAIARERLPNGTRINLTFRWIRSQLHPRGTS